MDTETKVAGHYGRAGLEGLILSALAKQGKDPALLSVADLAPMDEFHVDGHAAA